MADHERIQYIDVWRIIAVTMVIAHHILSYSTLSPYFTNVPRIVHAMQGIGRLGVLIFFCISGFVICRGLIAEQAETGAVSLSAFYVRRTLRIIPPLLVYLAAVVLLTYLGAVESKPFEIAKAAAFLCNIPLEHLQCGFFTAHTWSLAYEEQFYLGFPLLFILAALVRKPAILIGAMLIAAAGAVMISISGRLFVPAYLSTFLYMLSGCATALYWDRLRKHLLVLPVAAWAIAVSAVILAALPFGMPAWVRVLLGAVVQPVLICIMVFGTPTTAAIFRGFWRSAALSRAGKMSYGIYLWQQLATAAHPSLPSFAVLVLMAGVLVISYLSYEYFERPLIKLGAQVSARLAARRAAFAQA